MQRLTGAAPRMPRASYNRLSRTPTSVPAGHERSNSRERTAFAATVFKQQQTAVGERAGALTYWFGTCGSLGVSGWAGAIAGASGAMVGVSVSVDGAGTSLPAGGVAASISGE